MKLVQKVGMYGILMSLWWHCVRSDLNWYLLGLLFILSSVQDLNISVVFKVLFFSVFESAKYHPLSTLADTFTGTTSQGKVLAWYNRETNNIHGHPYMVTPSLIKWSGVYVFKPVQLSVCMYILVHKPFLCLLV